MTGTILLSLATLFLLITALWQDFQLTEIKKRIEAIEEKQKPKLKQRNKSTCKSLPEDVLKQSCFLLKEPKLKNEE